MPRTAEHLTVLQPDSANSTFLPTFWPQIISCVYNAKTWRPHTNVLHRAARPRNKMGMQLQQRMTPHCAGTEFGLIVAGSLCSHLFGSPSLLITPNHFGWFLVRVHGCLGPCTSKCCNDGSFFVGPLFTYHFGDAQRCSPGFQSADQQQHDTAITMQSPNLRRSSTVPTANVHCSTPSSPGGKTSQAGFNCEKIRCRMI